MVFTWFGVSLLREQRPDRDGRRMLPQQVTPINAPFFYHAPAVPAATGMQSWLAHTAQFSSMLPTG
jgi:hypothetical protein